VRSQGSWVLTCAVLGCVALARPVLAGDAQSPFADDQPAPSASQPPPAVPRPAMRGWHTIVIPAAAAAQAPVVTGSLPPAAAPVAKAPTPAAGRAHTQAPAAQPVRPLTGYAHELSGLASFYWQAQMTSSGERFDRRGLTAAHKTLPLGTRVRVTNLSNGRSIIVRINDRGPFKAGRVIDLSEAAAEQIAMTGQGVARVALEVVH
jgi:rare lipoprotein A (peptidoglycan hydrolase)